jgi:hypothetical protein
MTNNHNRGRGGAKPPQTQSHKPIDHNSITAIGTSEHDPNTNQQSHHGKKERKHWIEYAALGFACLAALGGAFAAGFNGWQAYIGKDTEKRELRAYVYAVPSVSGVVANATPTVLVDLKNGGETPAYNPDFGMEWLILPYPQTNDMETDFAGTHTVREFIYRDHELTESVPAGDGTPITQAQVDSLHNGSAALYVFGGVEYLDAFKTWHHTYFCFVMLPQNFGANDHSYGYCDSKNGNNDAD